MPIGNWRPCNGPTQALVRYLLSLRKNSANVVAFFFRKLLWSHDRECEDITGICDDVRER
jgi:hypothetical protein